MKTVQLDLPEDLNEHDVKMIVAGVLFEKDLLSSGRAANAAGLQRENS